MSHRACDPLPFNPISGALIVPKLESVIIGTQSFQRFDCYFVRWSNLYQQTHKEAVSQPLTCVCGILVPSNAGAKALIKLTEHSRRLPLGIIGGEARSLLVLAGPIAFTQLGAIANGFIDFMMVGRLGSAELAGVALGNVTYFLFFGICSGIIHAVGPIVSQAFGAGEKEPIARTLGQAFLLGIVLAIPVVVLFWFAAPVWTVLNQDPANIELGQGYLRATMWGFLPHLWFYALRDLVEAVSRPWAVTRILFAGIVLNVIANYGLMYGNFGLPRLGHVGTGWATTIVHSAMFLAVLVYVQSRPAFRRLKIFSSLAKFHGECFRELLRIGLPIGGTRGLGAGMSTCTAFFIGTFGAAALAAHQIALQTAAVAWMMAVGIGQATMVRVGQNVGGRNFDRARWSGYLGMGLALIFMTGAALAFLFTPDLLISFYLPLDEPDNAETALIGVELLGLAAFFILFDGLVETAKGALQGLKDTKLPMVYCFIGYWLVGIPTGLVLGYGFGWGPPGFWWGMTAGLFAASLMVSVRFCRLTHGSLWRRGIAAQA